MAEYRQAFANIIVENEAGSGYYTYPQWLTLNQLLFRLSENESCVPELWRIFKIVSAGHESIATELVGESLLLMLQLELTEEEVKQSMLQLFAKVFQKRFYRLEPRQLESISFMKRLRSVVISYRRSIRQMVLGSEGSQPKQQSRLNLIYLYGKAVDYKRSLNIVKRIEQQMEQCPFEPTINDYILKQERRPLYQSARRDSQEEPRGSDAADSQSEQGANPELVEFKATPFPKHLFEEQLKIDTRTKRLLTSLRSKKVESLHQSRAHMHFQKGGYRAPAQCTKSHLLNAPVKPSTQGNYLQEKLLKPKTKKAKKKPLFKIVVNNRNYVVYQGDTAESVTKAIQKLQGRKDGSLFLSVSSHFASYHARHP